MIIHDIKVDWKMEWANTPSIQLLVSNVPTSDELAYEVKDDLYFAQKDGYVSFYSYHAPGSGYGGRTFNINMMDGTKKSLKGPWSSGCYHANKLFLPSVEVQYTEDRASFDRGHTFFGGAATIHIVAWALNKHLPDVVLKPYWFLGSDLCWQPVWEKNLCHHENGINGNGRCKDCRHKVLSLGSDGVWYEIGDESRLVNV